MSKPWGNIGAWAADAERAEAEEREVAAAAAGGGGGDSQSFPSLKEGAAAKPKKKKMSLQEFNLQTAAAGRRDPASGLTHDEMLRLPTGPKERFAEELPYGRLGGGFSNYGRSESIPGRNFRDRDGDGDGSWGGGRRSYGGFDDERRAQPPARVSDFDQPSRADEVDNWAVNKKQLGSFDSGRPSRYGSLGVGDIGGGGGMSRADEVDNWAAGKKPITSRPSNFGLSSRDAGPEPDRWTRRGFRETEPERPRLILDPPRGEEAVVEVVKSNKPNPFGAARPREEVLAEKGLDWKKMDLQIEAKKTSRPTSSQSSRPSSAQSSRSEGPALQGVEGTVKLRPKLNPFGDAKPREVLLEEKGMDWRKIDMELEHRRVGRPEMEAENLKNEISDLKKELVKISHSNANREGGEHSSLHDLILSKERNLELLSRELDDKVRFGQKAIERPGSGAGRVSGMPPPQSGVSEVAVERPRSRGTGDTWTRQGDDRRVFQGGWGRGFSGNRDINRSRSRERW